MVWGGADVKRELWPKVRVGSYVIYADEYDGVFRAMVSEVDIRIYEPGVPSRWGYPYGMTLETGVVKIQYDGAEKIENLTNLIQYSAARLEQLREDWEKWQQEKAEAEGFREIFLQKALQFRGL